VAHFSGLCRNLIVEIPYGFQKLDGVCLVPIPAGSWLRGGGSGRGAGEGEGGRTALGREGCLSSDQVRKFYESLRESGMADAPRPDGEGCGFSLHAKCGEVFRYTCVLVSGMGEVARPYCRRFERDHFRVFWPLISVGIRGNF